MPLIIYGIFRDHGTTNFEAVLGIYWRLVTTLVHKMSPRARTGYSPYIYPLLTHTVYFVAHNSLVKPRPTEPYLATDIIPKKMAASNVRGGNASSSAPAPPLESALHPTAGEISTPEDNVATISLPVFFL